MTIEEAINRKKETPEQNEQRHEQWMNEGRF